MVQLARNHISGLFGFSRMAIQRQDQFFQLIISFFRKLMQKLGKAHQQGHSRRNEVNSTSRQEKSSRSHLEDSQVPSSKSKKITKIIHNTVIFYVDEKGQTKTLFYQKLRDRKSRENKTNQQKIRRQAQENNKKIKNQVQATCISPPQVEKQQQPQVITHNWIPNYCWPLQFMSYPAVSPLS